MSHRICKTAKELSEAIKEETDVIEVEGDLSNKIVSPSRQNRQEKG